MQVIDCRGLSCPAPVIETKKAIERSAGEPLQVLLDDGAARENVLRFCKSKGYTTSEVMGEDGASLIISCNFQPQSIESLADKSFSPVIVIASDRLGDGPDELGRLLLKNFIITLIELEKQPEKIIFVNSGVLLTTEGSELLEPLGKLLNAGVDILSCGVCLDYYRIREKLAVGEVTNMYTIAESMLLSGNSIKL
jgi:selenium metabolism protein YedF